MNNQNLGHLTAQHVILISTSVFYKQLLLGLICDNEVMYIVDRARPGMHNLGNSFILLERMLAISMYTLNFAPFTSTQSRAY